MEHVLLNGTTTQQEKAANNNEINPTVSFAVPNPVQAPQESITQERSYEWSHFRVNLISE